MSTTYDTSNRNSRIARDVTVMACIAAPNSGNAGTAIDIIGTFKTAEISLKRAKVDTTGPADGSKTSRALMWDNGSVKLTGFSRGAGSKLAVVFAAGYFVIFQLSEAATGDAWQLMCTNDDFSKSIGAEATMDSITLGVEGTPYFGAAGSPIVPMVLEA